LALFVRNCERLASHRVIVVSSLNLFGSTSGSLARTINASPSAIEPPTAPEKQTEGRDLMEKSGDDKAPVVHDATTTEEKARPAVTATTGALENAPTDSHALATQEHEEKGEAQMGHNEPEVKDLGWDKVAGHQPTPLVGGLPNEELWTLVRRFNHVCFPLFRGIGSNCYSNCIMSRRRRRLYLVAWISTLRMKMSFRQTSSAAQLSVCT
jgi:Protein of unknown function (DUF3292)